MWESTGAPPWFPAADAARRGRTLRRMTPREVDLPALRALCMAADTGTLGRAAVRLHVSQPALSKRLQALEASLGVQLLERSPHGVRLTPAGRRLYELARQLIDHADAVAQVMTGLSRDEGVVHLAASHSSTEAFVAEMLARLNGADPLAVELVTANSLVVRDMVADGRADVGIAASRPHATPTPAVREEPLADDEIVCAVPPGHRWAGRPRISQEEFLATPMVVRDPTSNARWTVDAVLRETGLQSAPPLAQGATPSAVKREARARHAPLLLSRHVLAGSDFVPLEVEGLRFPRQYRLVLPSVGAPTGATRHLIECVRDHVRIWLR
jgi:LysR family transcriptional regulator, carnitine catabolism transcriptional activator